MLTLKDAKQLVESYLKSIEEDETLLTMDTDLIEKDFGWIFFYNTKSYIDTGDNLDMLIGNAPILVDKKTKDIHIFGTSHPINYYIEEYERGNCEYKHSTN